MSEKRILEIGRELEALTRTAETISKKYVAHFALHAAAVLEGDKEVISEHRRSLHVLLDRLLDNGEQVQARVDEITVLSRIG
jgi:hypothetical protein